VPEESLVPQIPRRARQTTEGERLGRPCCEAERTRVVNLKGKGARLDFLGYTYRYDRDLYARAAAIPERDPVEEGSATGAGALRAMTNVTQSHKPSTRLLAELNRHLKGSVVRIPTGGLRADQQQRLFYHLRRRSQRPLQPPDGVSFDAQWARMGFQLLSCPALSTSARACGCMASRRMREICTSGSTRGRVGRSPGVTFSPPLPVRAVSRPPLDSVAGQPNEGEPRTPGIDDNRDPTPEGSGVFPHHPAGAPLVRG